MLGQSATDIKTMFPPCGRGPFPSGFEGSGSPVHVIGDLWDGLRQLLQVSVVPVDNVEHEVGQLPYRGRVGVVHVGVVVAEEQLQVIVVLVAAYDEVTEGDLHVQAVQLEIQAVQVPSAGLHVHVHRVMDERFVGQGDHHHREVVALVLDHELPVFADAEGPVAVRQRSGHAIVDREVRFPIPLEESHAVASCISGTCS